MSLFSSLREGAAPPVAVEIAAGRVSAASLEWRGGQPVVALHATELLPGPALVPSLTAANTHDRASVMTALNRVLEKVGRPRRVGLVVPDAIAKVSLVRFEHVPARSADLDQLVRWQVRKSAPFAIDEAQVTYVPGLRHSDGQEFVVSLARRDIVQEYEGLCAEAGCQAGLVDIATFNVINAVLAGSAPPAVDWLLVNVAADSASIALLRGPHLIFFRNRASDMEGTLADLVHQTAMYYEDRLGDVDQVRRSLADRLAAPVETIDPRAAVSLTDRISAAPALLDTLAPLVGILLRDRKKDAVPA
jgi:type IV pilus assembly protein PilM